MKVTCADIPDGCSVGYESLTSLNQVRRAFTLIELLVVLAVLAVVSFTLMPALCRVGPQSKVAACAANFRQWAVSANLYAKDNQDFLPSFDTAGGGRYIWDVGTNMCDALSEYGVTVPMWFCPVRPQEMDPVNQWAIAVLGHPTRNVQDLRAYFSRNYPSVLVINHNYWVPRIQAGWPYPTDYSRSAFVADWLKAAPSTQLGWPTTTSDKCVSRVPFVSDKCASGSGSGLAHPTAGVGYGIRNISPNTAHFANGRFSSVNAAYADGHVETHGPEDTKAAYSNGSTYWFY